ncbi:DUF4181 domain-containing protein [Anaerobacillus alkaliphilus]|uniref:DUF4181 domain-containing protein n=1 Tax=Anaerobacillus alkaliphilus TaxID=1548597 RepID=A0A4Q0VRM4_9BACI|nr:DUF4181 domain-containing protein [Anaerobacillus alkaliphilus]RXJ00234.1 DUF4181 domain-containing protein [Anaerobacillus alkaliphilus]
MIEVFIFLGLVFILWVLTNRKVKARFNLEERVGFRRHVHPTQIWGEIYIILIMLFILYLVGPDQSEYAVIFGFIIPLGLYQLFMEWKYDRASNHYRLTIVNISFLIIAFVGLLIFTFPKTINETYQIFIFSEDGEFSEKIEIEVNGKLRRNLFYGDMFEGKMAMAEQEFLTINYGRENKISFRANQFLHTMVGLNSSNRGEVWTEKDMVSFAGKLIELEPFTSNHVKFAGPAETIEEALLLYEQLTPQ